MVSVVCGVIHPEEPLYHITQETIYKLQLQNTNDPTLIKGKQCSHSSILELQILMLLNAFYQQHTTIIFYFVTQFH